MLNTALRNRLAFASLLSLFAFLPQTASAAPCTVAGPVAANAKTTVVYDPLTATMKACIAGTWLDMSGGGGGGGGNLDGLTDVTIASPSTNQALVYNGSAWVNATLSLTETDPKVGALTGNQWCAANAGGTAIVCNQAAPSGGGSSSGTAGFVQISGGSGAFASSSTTAGQQLFWDGTNHRLGIGVNTPTTQLTIGTTGTITVQNGGSAATPAYAVTTGGLGVNGMFVPAANSLAFVTSATERVRIDGNGDLGIGVTSPDWKLHISDAIAPVIQLAEVDSGGNAFIGVDGNNLFFRRGTIGTTDAMTIASTGNVGIGTVSPTLATLHIKGNAPVLALEGTDHAYAGWYPEGSGAGRKAWLGFGGAGSPDFSIFNQYATGAINLATNNTSRLYITGAGSVGIGTTSPGVTKLMVTGTSTGTYVGYFQNTDTHGLLGQGTTYGIVGYATAAGGNGILGQNTNTNAYGYLGNATTGVAGYAGSGGYGVYGQSPTTYGVYGRSMAAGSGGVLGYDAQGTYYGIVGYANAWSLYGNASIYIAGTYQGSDRRLKENIEDLKSPLETLLKVHPVSFTWKKDAEQSKSAPGKQYGVIAQEVMEILPEVTKEIEAAQPTALEPDKPIDESKLSLNQKLGKFYGVEYEKFIPLLIGAVQELKTENDTLKSQLESMNQRLEKLEGAQ